LSVHAKDLFDGANGETRRALSAASLLADQQDKRSGTYQQRNQNTNDERGSPTPTLDGLHPAPFSARRRMTHQSNQAGLLAAMENRSSG
jgi:hypothetical protein